MAPPLELDCPFTIKGCGKSPICLRKALDEMFTKPACGRKPGCGAIELRKSVKGVRHVSAF